MSRPVGHPPRRPTIEQIHMAAELAKGAVRSRFDGRLIEADVERVCEAVGIPSETYRRNKGKPHWAEFILAIRTAQAQSVVKVAAKRYMAALSDDDTTRGQAREGFLKQNAGWAERLEVTGDDGGPVKTATVIRLSGDESAKVRKLIREATRPRK